MFDEKVEDGEREPGAVHQDVDSLELVVMLEKHYGVVIKDIEEGRPWAS